MARLKDQVYSNLRPFSLRQLGGEMGRLENIRVRVSVALTPEDWREVLLHLRGSDLHRQILEQLTDAIGSEYTGQLIGPETGQRDNQ